MSIQEVKDMVDSYNRTYRRKMKEELLFNQILSIQIKQEILPLLVEKLPEGYKPMQLWDIFPNLFAEEKKVYEKQQELSELEEFKRKRYAFMVQHNEKFGGDIE